MLVFWLGVRAVTALSHSSERKAIKGYGVIKEIARTWRAAGTEEREKNTG